jgi:hypothetical protein
MITVMDSFPSPNLPSPTSPQSKMERLAPKKEKCLLTPWPNESREQFKDRVIEAMRQRGRIFIQLNAIAHVLNLRHKRRDLFPLLRDN